MMRDQLQYRGLILGAWSILTFVFPRVWVYGHSVDTIDDVFCTILMYVLFAGITGNVLAEDIQHFISNGANEVIPKPLTKAKLFNVMQHYASM